MHFPLWARWRRGEKEHFLTLEGRKEEKGERKDGNDKLVIFFYLAREPGETHFCYDKGKRKTQTETKGALSAAPRRERGRTLFPLSFLGTGGEGDGIRR